MIRFLTESDVARLLTVRDALGLVEDAARALATGGAMNMPRQRPRTDEIVMHVLPAAYGAARTLGLKAYTSGKRGAAFWYLLFDGDGSLLALMHANNLGQIRTGAATGVATKYMSRSESRTVAVIGTGFQARSQLEAVCLVREIAAVRVWGRTPEHVETFAREMSAKVGVAVEPAPSVREAVAGADVVVTMTSASKPVLEGAWLREGTHVNAAGSNRINAAEIDPDSVRRAGVVAVEDVAQAKVESGDLQLAIEAGAFSWDRTVLLSDIVAGKAPGRHDAREITLFESLGIGLWDAAVARFVYDRAVEQGLGIELPVVEPPRKAR